MLYANPEHIHEEGRGALEKLMHQYGVQNILDIPGGHMIDYEEPPMLRIMDGTAGPKDFYEACGHMSKTFSGFYGLPRVRWPEPNNTFVQRQLEAPFLQLAEHAWPDCSVGTYVGSDLPRLIAVRQYVKAAQVFKKTVAVLKGFNSDTLGDLESIVLMEYARDVIRLFPVRYLWMAGRWQYRVYAALPPGHPSYDAPDTVLSRAVWGERYVNNHLRIIRDTLEEAEAQFRLFQDAQSTSEPRKT